MKEQAYRLKASVQIFILIATALVFCGLVPAHGNNDAIKFSENANIALRRTAHQLLVINGDSTSQIPPVQQTDPNTFSVRLENMFDYEKLPDLLKQSLEIQGIKLGYNVVVTSCLTNEMLLGYSFLDLGKKGGVACGGRKRDAGCYNLQVSFIPVATASVAGDGNWWLFTFSALVALGFIVWKSSMKTKDPAEIELVPMSVSSKMEFGHSFLDLHNQILTSGSVSHNLTYREAKLLRLFIGNANQILERDFILKSVWEDEGIIVGRSVDVFVSRLRKLLAADPTVKIAAVHGIGYRMEILP